MDFNNPRQRRAPVRGEGRPAVYLISRPEQVEALASAARQEIVDGAQALGRCSIREIAELLGRPADGLYYHVKALVDVGLLVQVGERPAGRRREAIYATPGRRMKLRHDPGNADAARRVAAGALRLAQRDLDRALRSPASTPDGPRRDTWGGRVKGWASERDLEEINRLIERITGRMSGGRRARGARLVSFAFALAPLDAKPRRRTAAKGQNGATSS